MVASLWAVIILGAGLATVGCSARSDAVHVHVPTCDVHVRRAPQRATCTCQHVHVHVEHAARRT